MTQPTRYDPLHDFSGDQRNADIRDELDAEFGAIQRTLDETLDNLALLQRDDEALTNGIVTPDSLSDSTLALIGQWTARGAWSALTSYNLRDLVTFSGCLYVAVETHTSGSSFPTDLVAGKWLNLTTAGATPNLSLVVPCTASQDVGATDTFMTFTNAGAAGSVTLTLPTPSVGLEYEFVVVAAQSLVVNVDGSVVIAIGELLSSAGGTATASSPYSSLRLKCLSSTLWVAIAVTGTWTLA